MKSKVILFGANGFTGRYFIEYLENNGLCNKYEFIGVDYRIDFPERYSKVYECDLTIVEHIKIILDEIKPDIVFNFTGLYGNEDFEKMLDINVKISANILETVIKQKMNNINIVLIGSAAEYGNENKNPISECSMLKPINLYGLTKKIQTDIANYYINSYNLNIKIARTFNLFGDGISNKLAIGSFQEKIKNLRDGEILNVGNINSRRDYIHIKDAVAAYWEIATKGKKGEIYNVASGKSTGVDEILQKMVYRSGKKLKIEVDNQLLKNKDIDDIYGSNTKLISDTGWKIRYEF